MQADRKFLEHFLVEHLPRMRAFVRLRMPSELRQRFGESDVMQLACVQVLDGARSVEFQGEPALLNWLFGAVENAVRDLLRNQRAACRSPDREVSNGDQTLLVSYATFCTPSRIAAAREEVARIEKAMDALSPAQRDAVMLSCLVGLSHAEIAAQTGMSNESVRTHLHRGLARLSALIEGGGGPP